MGYNEAADVPRLVETRSGKKIFLQPKNFLPLRYNKLEIVTETN